MKKMVVLLLVLVCAGGAGVAQQPARAKNLVVFLMDGYRWRELFQGADSGILFDRRFNHVDSAYTVAKYWAPDRDQRRRKLMPFVWETMAAKGQLWGNRELGSANVLEFIDRQRDYHGKVVSFASWDAIARILNRKRNGMLVNIYGEDVKGSGLSPAQVGANLLQHLMPDIFGNGERLDGSTYLLARADETYFLAMGPGVEPRGEVRNGGQVWEEQFAATLASLLGLKFAAPHSVAPGISLR